MDAPEGCSWPSDVYEGPRRHGDATWPFEGWWLLMAGRGQRATPEQVQAILDAQPYIARFKGGPIVGQPAAAFARSVVRDALFAAPQPLTQDWVKFSLGTVARLAQWCENTGQPMTTTHVLCEQVRRRYLFDARSDLSTLTLRTYQSRLDVIATAVLAPPVTPKRNVVGLGLPMLDPTTPREEVRLWTWAAGLRPQTRRRRLQAILALTLGTGARRRDLCQVAAGDITRNAEGVHVHFHGADTDRVVTCRRGWEDRLWALTCDLAPERAVAAPQQNAPVKTWIVDSSVEKARRAYPTSVAFSPITLRSGWMVRHLTMGTPLNVLMPAAQITHAQTVVQLLKHIPTPDAGAAATVLRGA